MANLAVFTLEAANAMIPRLSGIMSRQFVRRSEIETRLKSLGQLTGELPNEIVHDERDTEEVRDLKRELIRRIQEYQDAWREVEEMGCVLKDPRMGLIDFYGRVDGKLVWLCWKYGESEVTHFHALDEGYSARKELRHSIKQRLLN
jgi:hypothetical protein